MTEEDIKLIEHLRLVHFTLLVASMSLFFVSIDRDNQSLLAEYQVIANLVHHYVPESYRHYDSNKGILEQEVRAQISPTVPNIENTYGELTIEAGPSAMKLKLFHQVPTATIFHQPEINTIAYTDFFAGMRHASYEQPSSLKNLSRNRGFADRFARMEYGSGPWVKHQSAPSTVGEFIDLWNTVDAMRNAYVLKSIGPPEVYIVEKAKVGKVTPRGLLGHLKPSPSFSEEQLGLVARGLGLRSYESEWRPIGNHRPYPLETDKLVNTEPLLFTTETMPEVGNDRFSRTLFAIFGMRAGRLSEFIEIGDLMLHDYVVVSNAIFEHKSLNIQERFLSISRDEKRRQGDFATSFPNLRQFIGTFEAGLTINLPLLGELIRKDAVKSGEKIEIIGVKISRERIGVWGAIILILVQLYFFLHIHEFLQRVRRGAMDFNVAWIGLYIDKLSLGTFLISISVVPVVASSIGVWNASDATAISSMSASIAWVSFVIALGTMYVTFQYRRYILIARGAPMRTSPR